MANTRESLGEAHSDTLNAMNGLAVVLHHRNELDEAASLLSDSYRICLESLGSGHIRTIDSANGLARVLRRLDRLDEAAELATLNLQRARDYFGEEQGDLA